MEKTIKFIEILFKDKTHYLVPIDSFQYFDFTLQESIVELSRKNNKVYESLMTNYVSFLLIRDPQIRKLGYIETDLTMIDFINENKIITGFNLYDEYNCLIYKLSVKKYWYTDERNLTQNRYQKNYLHKGCLGVNIKKSNYKNKIGNENV